VQIRTVIQQVIASASYCGLFFGNGRDVHVTAVTCRKQHVTAITWHKVDRSENWERYLRLHFIRLQHTALQRICRQRAAAGRICVWLHTDWTTTLVPTTSAWQSVRHWATTPQTSFDV